MAGRSIRAPSAWMGRVLAALYRCVTGVSVRVLHGLRLSTHLLPYHRKERHGLALAWHAQIEA
jgi:hypothetical protein